MTFLLSRLFRNGTSGDGGATSVAPLKPICNVYEDASFAHESDAVRFNIFENKNMVHKHYDEEGFFLFMQGSPKATIRENTGRAKKGEVFFFMMNDWHGFMMGGRALAFHTNKPYENMVEYKVLSIEMTPHPDGGENLNIKIMNEMDEEEQFVWGPDIHKSARAGLKEIEENIRRRNGYDLFGERQAVIS